MLGALLSSPGTEIRRRFTGSAASRKPSSVNAPRMGGLAARTSVHRSVSECYLALPQGEGHSPVVLGQPGDAEPLLGVVTLEILGLVFDPFRRVLHPMRALMV